MAFQDVDALEWYATCSYFKPDVWPDRLLKLAPPSIRRRIERELWRRRYDQLSDKLIRRHTSTEFLERLLLKSGAINWRADLVRRRNRLFPSQVIRLMHNEPVDALWCPVDALEALVWAKNNGVLAILEQPIGHFTSLHEILVAEHERHPAFFREGVSETPAWLRERQDRAVLIADKIAVGCDFAAGTMVEHDTPENKVVVIPYGYDTHAFPSVRPQRAPLRGRPMEFLFVGIVGARKGLAYLLEAFKDISPSVAKLTIAGLLDMPQKTLGRYQGHFNYVGQLRRQDVADQMRRADCFIFPSLFEGGGIVLYEAIAAGLGIIQSKNCGLAVKTGVNGILLPHVSTETVSETIRWAIDNPQAVEAWGEASWNMREDFDWSHYHHGARKLVSDALGVPLELG